MAGEEQHHCHAHQTEGEQRGELIRPPSTFPFLISDSDSKCLWAGFQKCELYWPQPRDTGKVKEEEEDHGERREEKEEEGGVKQIGRFLLKVRDSREENGFTVTDIEVQVHKLFTTTLISAVNPSQFIWNSFF